MRIGIDVTALPTQLFGAGNYIVNLTQTLIRMDPANDYLIFSKPRQIELFAGRGHAQVVRVNLPTRYHRIAWEQTFFPLLIRRYRLDVVHSPHYTMPVVAPCAKVVTFHDMTFFLHPEAHLFYKLIFFRGMIPVSSRYADALIAISQNTRADMLRLLPVNPTKLFTIPYGIAPIFRPMPKADQEAALRKYDLPVQFILYVGNLEPRKNLPMLLRAFAALVRRGLPHSLVLAGSRGWMDEEVFATLRELNLGHRVFLPGYIPQAELPALYSAASLFVYASRYEGFGLPVLEAMACGAPVITSNVASMPEIAGDAGVLVQPDDQAGLTDAMARVLSDQELRARLAREGLARSKIFSWERAAEETLAVYARVAHAR
ncbi:MAG: glycosyltransferase family 4 protein [Chloroflexi bacterium]|nr:glycosyltransferase family 4 protein [Chloroflexota bacterium]